ncbi:MAG: N-acetylmuramoyl-L-alanine amidase [Bryobacterales bacterium]|nr:N-acetylmuramoyl-L-alanine amidase [Bryobacterales bacterium]
MKRRLILGATIFAACLSAQSATQPLQVVDVRFWSLKGVTRVAIETNGEFTYRSDHIPNPDRLFFDIVGAIPRTKRIAVKPVNDKLLKRIRIAQTIPGVTRVVFDLENSVDYTASQLGSPDRLIIELRPAAAPPAPSVITQSLPEVGAPNPPSFDPGPVKLSTAKLPALIPRGPDVASSPVPTPEMSTPPALLAKPAPSVPPSVAAMEPAAANPARRLSADGSRSLTRALGLKINRVVIDPGHGGHDQGTTGPKGLLEKDLVLDVALRLGKLIEQRLGSEVIFTRSDDTFIPLTDRTAMANQKKADLFLSIHANSSPVPRVSGIETYYLNFTTSPEALDVAARENASSQNTIADLSDLVSSIAKHDKIEESREFASDVQGALQTLESRYSPTAKDRGIRKAPFLVLIGAQMPSILAEIGFLSNPREENNLMRADYRQKLAEALYKGLSRYTQTLSHFELSKK